jgi:hypothetical protein
MATLHSIPKDLLIDPIIAKPSPTYLIERGAKEYNFQRYICQTWSNSSMNFQVIPPNNQVFVDRVMYIEMQMQTTFTTASGTGTVFPGNTTEGVCSLRWMPLNSGSSNIEVQINNSTVNINGYDYLEPLCRYNQDKDFENLMLSVGPSMHDHGTYDQSYNSNLSPLASFFSNSVQQPRGAIQGTIVSQGTGTAVVNWHWYEPIMISPLVFSKLRTPGFYGVNNLTFTFTLNNINNWLSYDNVNGTPLNASSGISNSLLIANPILYINYLTPLVPLPVQDNYLYPYYKVIEFKTEVGSIAAGASASVTTNNIQLTAIPSKVFIVVKQYNSSKSWSSADIYGYISNIKCDYLNKTNILANASPLELYERCVSNGYNYSWIDWSQYSGSVICLDFGRDMPLDDGYVVGLQTAMNFQSTITFTNLFPDTTSFTVFVIALYDGVFSIDNGIAMTETNLVTPEDIASSSPIDAQQSQVASEISSYAQGGDFAGTARKFVRSAANTARRGYNFYKENQPAFNKAFNVAKVVGQSAAELLPYLLAAGFDESEAYEHLRRKGYDKHELQGLGLSGAGLSGAGSRNYSGGKLIKDSRSLLTGIIRPSLSQRY